MKINDEFVVNIEAFSNSGDGIAKIDGQVVFVEGACPEDEVKIKIFKVNKNFANAKIQEIITPSPHRTEPFCPMQKVCGACNIQFIDYDFQLEIKHQIVQDAMKKIAHIETPVSFPISSPKIKNFRQKIQYPIAQTKNSKRIIAGYYKPKSHEIVNIKYCPIQPEMCDKIIDFIREEAPKSGISGYDEKSHTGDLRHVVIRGSEYSNKFLVTLVVNRKYELFSESDKFVQFAKILADNFDEISGVCLNFNHEKTNVIMGEESVCLVGVDFVEEKIIDKIFKIGTNTFFQVNPQSAENIFKYVKEEVSKSENPTVLDAYAGIATFGIVVSDVSKFVVSVEENKESIEKAKEVITSNNINNVEVYAQDTLKYLISIKKKFDITILDPPRKGCAQEVLDETLKHTKEKIIYVSCNPATLARDLKYLQEKGCKVKSIQPFDMFCHTTHVETVAIIEV